MEDKTKLLSVKLDLVFKLIFGDQRNTDILASFLKSVLDIPEEEYEHITIIDPFVKADYPGDKYGILDVKIHTKSGRVIHTEIQVNPIEEMDERTLYYQSKLVTEQLGIGQNFSQIKKVVSIIITDYTIAQLSGSDRYHHQFRYRTGDGVELTDLVELNTLELPKLPREADKTELWNWMRFIQSNDEEELRMLATRSPELKKAVVVLKELSTDERTRMIAEAREKARRDEASRINSAEKRGREEGREVGREEGREEGKREKAIAVARKLLGLNMPIDEIAEATDLSCEEIKALG
jgi:predicted transposase/invertase (TIGR01784 family)